MSEKRKSWLMLASLALNIFLVAFVLGRNSAILPFPPPMGGMPPFMQSGMPHAAVGMNALKNPPFIMPEMLLSKEEMDAEQPFAMARFEKIRELRKQFATDIEKNNLSQEQIVAHFEQIEAVMEELKNHMKEKIAAKIAGMSPEERKRFIQELMRE